MNNEEGPTTSTDNVVQNVKPEQLMKLYNTRFKQQKLPSKRISLTPTHFSPIFIMIGMFFIPFGIGLLFSSSSVNEKIIDYTDCTSLEKNGSTCAQVIEPVAINGTTFGKKCSCSIDFNLKTNFKGKVMIYYALTNFYQNHRRYGRSRNNKQFYGLINDGGKECEPFTYDKETNKTIWPCGSMANSMFQDEISIYSYEMTKSIQLERKGIAWESDIAYKFKNPPNWNTEEFRKHHIRPKRWVRDLEDGLLDEDFVVWMRVSALPDFRKLYRSVVNVNPEVENTLPIGEYRLDIIYSFYVSSFKGTKSVIISTLSFFGGRNWLLGIGYIVVGILSLTIGLIFLYIHCNAMKITTERRV